MKSCLCVCVFVRALRDIDLAEGPPAGRSGPLAPRDAATRSAIESLRGMLDTDAVTAAWDAALQVPEWDSAPVWLHTDLAPGNVLLAGGRAQRRHRLGGRGRRRSGLRPARRVDPAPHREVLSDHEHRRTGT
jgi:hypothetical protein